MQTTIIVFYHSPLPGCTAHSSQAALLPASRANVCLMRTILPSMGSTAFPTARVAVRGKFILQFSAAPSRGGLATNCQMANVPVRPAGGRFSGAVIFLVFAGAVRATVQFIEGALLLGVRLGAVRPGASIADRFFSCGYKSILNPEYSDADPMSIRTRPSFRWKTLCLVGWLYPVSPANSRHWLRCCYG